MTTVHSSETELPVISEIERLTIAGQVHEFRFDPNCRICDSDQARMVNQLLTQGASYRAVLRALAPYNEGRNRQEAIGQSTIRRHAVEHFPIQSTGRNFYRDLLERRAAEQGIDFVEGVESILTPMAVVESIMSKGYERMMSNRGDPITPETTLRAAKELQTLLDNREDHQDAERMQLQLNRLIDSVKKHVPEQYWKMIVRDLNDEQSSDEPQPQSPDPALEAETVPDDEKDDQ